MTRASTWFDQHNAYLASPEWRARRAKVLERDRNYCQAQLHGCTGRATEVHHTSYAHWKAEPLWELRSVCGACHRAITDMDRARRAAAKSGGILGGLFGRGKR